MSTMFGLRETLNGVWAEALGEEQEDSGLGRSFSGIFFRNEGHMVFVSSEMMSIDGMDEIGILQEIPVNYVTPSVSKCLDLRCITPLICRNDITFFQFANLADIDDSWRDDARKYCSGFSIGKDSTFRFAVFSRQWSTWIKLVTNEEEVAIIMKEYGLHETLSERP